MEFLISLIFGLIASGIMSLFLLLIHNADQPGVHGIGSTVPRPDAWPKLTGPVVHFAVGMLMGLVYLALGGKFEPSVGGLFVLGAIIGLLRGVVTSLVLTLIAVGENTMGRFRDAGPGVAAWHLVGNLLFGIALTVLFGVGGVVDILSFSTGY